MASIKCTLYYHADRASRHIQQIYTGFGMLAESGLIEIVQRGKRYFDDPPPPQRHLRGAAGGLLIVGLSAGSDPEMLLFFDTNDYAESDEKNLEKCDCYFKRSYSAEHVNASHPKYQDRIYPLGLNYYVLPDRRSTMALRRSISRSKPLLEQLDGILSSIDVKNRLAFYPRLRNLNALPVYSAEPRVLFMVTAYDPYNDPQRAKDKIEEKVQLNEFRASCVRTLRSELGPRFFGGFVHNKFTRLKYKDVLIEHARDAKKSNYLSLLQDFPICVATSGLHGSIGWKLAEYVAFSRAIVTEKLQFEVPGGFQPEHNYLEFTSPESCAEQSMRLLNDCELRKNLMFNNSLYYQHYLRPDMLVFNAISTALKNRHKC
jgi:hypothetical protein